MPSSVRASVAAADSSLARLVQLKGIATTSASVLIDEGLVWRAFQNRRQIGGLLGFAPVKYESGESSHDQGISRAGNKRLQSVMVQLAWSWVHWQPLSALTLWYRACFGKGKRARKIGIVALARKLLIALWRWTTHGVLPAGAVLKQRVDRSAHRTRAACTARGGCAIGDRHGEGTAALVFGLRLDGLRGPRRCARARIEGEDGQCARTSQPNPRATALRSHVRIVDRRLRGPLLEWAACSAAITLARRRSIDQRT